MCRHRALLGAEARGCLHCAPPLGQELIPPLQVRVESPHQRLPLVSKFIFSWGPWLQDSAPLTGPLLTRFHLCSLLSAAGAQTVTRAQAGSGGLLLYSPPTPGIFWVWRVRSPLWCLWRFHCRNRSEPPRLPEDVPLHGACALGHLLELQRVPISQIHTGPVALCGGHKPMLPFHRSESLDLLPGNTHS